MKLIGTATRALVESASALLDDPILVLQMREAANPYGDGQAAKRIERILRERMVST
ncbi:UDP-N-acetylglucosamine 2-epimerase [compost metagenome]